VSLLPQVWRHVVGDPQSVGGLLSGARSVYAYYSRPRTSRTTEAPPRSSFSEEPHVGGLIDTEIPVGVAQGGPILGNVAAVGAGAILSAVGSGSPSTGTSPGDFEEGGVFEDRPTGWVLDGEPWDPYETGTTQEETAPPIFIPVDAAEEIPGDPPEQNEEEPMSTFWDIASGVVDVIQGQPVGNAGPLGFAPPVAQAGVGPRTPTGGTQNLRWDARSGRWVCKRRRRRRLLTESDFNDLMRIATLPNKQNVTVALAKAIGRRS